ncbi:ABC transporter permease [Bacillus cytotoxicus]|uniref:ABC transporter permease n=1 Tax=unclassified Bacillus cereus group TaxID=2750818 RepID=UPI001F59189D|nr:MULTISPECIES: ABC transporter permease [unclassified Bacillus cereus group]EMA6344680.1 ABC transporter permease [Bacillus cytotoxicus]
MIALIRYNILDYTKSYKYVPPIAIYIVSLLFVYTYKPNPIVSTYLETALMLYLLAAWITITLFHTEDPVQEQITLSHTKNIQTLYLGKYGTALLICSILSLISVIYPIAFQMFKEKMTLSLFITGFLAHFSLSILGVSIATLFTRNIIKKASTAWLSLSFVLLITIASIRLKKEWPELLWIFPPINDFMMLSSYKYNLAIHTLWLTTWALAYSFILMILFLYLVRRRNT